MKLQPNDSHRDWQLSEQERRLYHIMSHRLEPLPVVVGKVGRITDTELAELVMLQVALRSQRSGHINPVYVVGLSVFGNLYLGLQRCHPYSELVMSVDRHAALDDVALEIEFARCAWQMDRTAMH